MVWRTAAHSRSPKLLPSVGDPSKTVGHDGGLGLRDAFSPELIEAKPPQHQRKLSPSGRLFVAIAIGAVVALILTGLFLVPGRFGPVG